MESLEAPDAAAKLRDSRRAIISDYRQAFVRTSLNTMIERRAHVAQRRVQAINQTVLQIADVKKAVPVGGAAIANVAVTRALRGVIGQGGPCNIAGDAVKLINAAAPAGSRREGIRCSDLIITIGGRHVDIWRRGVIHRDAEDLADVRGVPALARFVVKAAKRRRAEAAPEIRRLSNRGNERANVGVSRIEDRNDKAVGGQIWYHLAGVVIHSP